MFRGTSISQKNFDNLIEEWSKPQPWAEVNRAIKERNRIINSVEGEDVKL